MNTQAKTLQSNFAPTQDDAQVTQAQQISHIIPAKIEWQTDDAGVEVPISVNFGDVYFSRANGLAETLHVFVQGNNLEQRIENMQPYTTFVIGELGFGTGLNILAVWQLWNSLRAKHAHLQHCSLQVITTELFPLTKVDLQRALQGWPELGELSSQLIESYPPLIKGQHRLNFVDDNFSIDLWLGDASESLTKVQSFTPVNAWLLDGFAPKCNQSLWADSVLAQIKRLSAVGTTAATFSVAGVIKRGLQEHGFSIGKVKGFGRKREMLVAHVARMDVASQDSDEQEKAEQNPEIVRCEKGQQTIAVIGAGITGLCTAYAFAKRGHKVVLFDKKGVLAGSSGNPRAMLAPKLTPIHHVSEHMHSISYLYSARYYTAVNTKAKGVYENTGVLDLLKQSNVAPEQVAEYPTDFAHILQSEDVHTQGYSSEDAVMLLEKGGLINPQKFAVFVLTNKNITLQIADVQKITHDGDGVTATVNLHTEAQTFEADALVVCTAQDCTKLLAEVATPRTTRGQISWVDVDASQLSKLPATPLKYGGYCTPMSNDGKQQFLFGASFVRGYSDLEINSEEHQISFEKMTTALPQYAEAIINLPTQEHWQARVGVRAQMPDYTPLCGKVTDNVYAMCAMGAKGFAFAPMLADMLCSMHCKQVAPLPAVLVNKLNPLRFNK